MGAATSQASFGDPIAVAAASGDEAAVGAWLDSGGQVDALFENPGGGVPLVSVLFLASVNGHLRIVDLVLKRGAGVDVPNSAGGTALMWSAFHGKPAVVRRLLSAGASLDIIDSHGCTALDYAKAQPNNASCNDCMAAIRGALVSRVS